MMNDQENRNPSSGGDSGENELHEGDLIEMIGESGENVTFVFIDALEYQEDIYLALAEPEEDDAVFFLRIEQDETGNDVYSAPDEELEDTLFEIFSTQREQDASEE